MKNRDGLSVSMVITLIQIGFGVTHRNNGYYDEYDNRVKLCSMQALMNRGLVDGRTTGGVMLLLVCELTEQGERLFEEYLPYYHQAKQRRELSPGRYVFDKTKT